MDLKIQKRKLDKKGEFERCVCRPSELLAASCLDMVLK